MWPVLTALVAAVCTGLLSWHLATRRMRALVREAHADPLTGLGNRRAFEWMTHDIDAASGLALLMVDLDHFKLVNDTEGHATGDSVLKRVARTLTQVIERSPTASTAQLFRLGGDEFAVMLPGGTEQSGMELSDRMRAALSASLTARHERGITISCGIACSPVHADSWDDLAACADRALYHAKQSGRNRTVVYTPIGLGNDTTSERFTMLHTLAMALGTAVDAKDAYTHAHSQNVADLAMYLARAMKLDDEAVDEIFMGGLLHDVGKVGVAESVLVAPRPLTPKDEEALRTHCEIGYRILHGIDGAEQIRDMVLYHHERVDGSGYPRQLRGADIPLAARIIAVADAFDSLTAERPGRPPLSTDDAIREIVSHTGSQFDAAVVDALCGLMLSDPAEFLASDPIDLLMPEGVKRVA